MQAEGYCECGCGERTTVPKWNNASNGDRAGVPKRFIRGHHHRVYRVERFWAKVDQRGPLMPEMDAPCWMWIGHVSEDGYGTFSAGRMVKAHRFAYELLVGPIPEGLMIDHRCRNTRCVNPTHLEPVTNRVNILRGTSPAARHARQTHCKRGHLLSGKNLYVRPGDGARVCRACKPLYKPGQGAV